MITTSGWPTWETHGSGTGSRHRCGGEDGWVNTRWAAVFHMLPQYQSPIKECYGEVRNVSTEGNCMETVVGISYTSFTYGTRLPDNGKLHFASPGACADWAGLWPMFQALGIKAMQQAPPPLPEAAPAWPRAAPASAASTLERLTQATQDVAAVPPPYPDNLRVPGESPPAPATEDAPAETSREQARVPLPMPKRQRCNEPTAVPHEYERDDDEDAPADSMRY